ncbi:hypothetical protein ACJJIU_03720 [Microbulbifer sp. CnH-101-E]|uniref:hypothetical protein n=1 Tax=unclassified Microbulbifer TaxID=2619833 RepID=UPI004039F3B9
MYNKRVHLTSTSLRQMTRALCEWRVMALTSLSLQIILEGGDTSNAIEYFRNLESPDIENLFVSSTGYEASRIELIYIEPTMDEDLFDDRLKGKLTKATNWLAKQPADLLECIGHICKASILIGGWLDDGNQMENLVLPPNFLLQVSRLGMPIEFLINDYHR